MAKMHNELKEREKELDCLYHLTPLLTSYRGSEEPLLKKITLELTNAMTHPGNVKMELAIESAEENKTPENKDLFTATNLTKKERLALYLQFIEGEKTLVAREENLLTSAVELTAAAVLRLRNEASIKKKNITLTELLSRLQKERDKDAESIQVKIRTFLFPLLNQVKQLVPVKNQNLISLIQTELEELTDRRKDFNSLLGVLTPRELEVCRFVARGMGSKEIAESLNISNETVERHRCTIRKKLNLNGKAVNLQNYLINL